MNQMSTGTGPAPTQRSLLSRFVGVLVSPRDTFAAVAAHPKWLGMLALTAGVVALSVGGFLMTSVGQQAWLDQTEAQSAAFGRPMTDQQYEGMQRMMPFAGYLAVAQFLIGIPLITLLLAAVAFGIFGAALGGDASFKQVYAVVVHAGAVSVLQQLFSVPLNYFRESLSSPTNLSVFVPMLPEGSFVTRLLGTIDIFLVWWTIVLAIGIATLYRRRTQPILWSFLAVYGVIALTIAAIMSRGGEA
jgi:hypothetical protein